MKMDYSNTIEKLIVAMISSTQVRFTSKQLKNLIFSLDHSLSENQIDNCFAHAKNDPRIKAQKVSTRKIYYSYHGAF